MAGKCYKLFCEEKSFWNDARINCFKNEADLASLSNNKLDIIREYLEQVQVRRQFGAPSISIGLFRNENDWKWLDGRTYNGSIPFKRVTKARLAWSDEDNDWILEAAKKSKEYDYVEGKSDLYLCQKMRGEATSKLFFSGVLHNHKRKFVKELHQVCEYLQQACGKKVPTINLHHAG